MRSNPIVLLVDDNLDNLQLLANALKSLNCDLAFSDDPRDVINQVNLIAPDLILMDVVMPEIDGYNLCCQLKTSKTGEHIPIIFLTALRDKASLVRAFKSGGVDFITKPYDMSELTVRIASHLQLNQANQELRKELNENQTAIDVLLRKYRNDLTRLECMVATTVETIIKPHLHSLRDTIYNRKQKQCIEVVLQTLESLVRPLNEMPPSLSRLTPAELKVVNLIKLGKSNKEISDVMCISLPTVAFHRKNIRGKLGLMNKKENLRCFLLSLEAADNY